jgi:hypothetical protein
MGYDEGALRRRAGEYEHKAKVLRQIQSEKLASAAFWDNALNYSTIIISAAVTVLTFFGVKNLHALLFSHVNYDVMEFLFNVLVFFLLIAAFLQMTLNLRERSLAHLRAIRDLTDFITLLDDIRLIKDVSDIECERQLERLGDRYKAINSILPANSDREWRAAKRKLEEKQA